MSAESLARTSVEAKVGRMSEAEWKRLRSDPACDALLDVPRDDDLAAECADLVQRSRDDRRAAKVEAQVRRDAQRESRNAHLQALSYALTADAYARATGVRPWDSYEQSLAETVGKFRTEVLGPELLTVAEVVDWAKPHSVEPGAADGGLTIPKANGYATVVCYRTRSVLERLATLAGVLGEHFGWGEANAVAFVLCDRAIVVNPVQVTRTQHYVTLRAHVDATFDEVADAYRQARAMPPGGWADGTRAKSLGERTLRAAGFAALRWQREWPDIYGEWCRRNSDDDRFADWRAFRRAALTGLRAL